MEIFEKRFRPSKSHLNTYKWLFKIGKFKIKNLLPIIFLSLYITYSRRFITKNNDQIGI